MGGGAIVPLHSVYYGQRLLRILCSSNRLTHVQCYFNPLRITQSTFLQALLEIQLRIPEDIESVEFSARKITFPIVLDDKWNKDALKRYMVSTRDKAVYLPSNIEYLARNNGLKDGSEALNKLIQSDFVSDTWISTLYRWLMMPL